uniref:Retrovirus-related Pol polyprotein from transposon TNT 1-94 n=2 Tax=Cajanus cajan TaxID=3821 RepID=A0A151QQU8_CAJCA|nr:Retrovirus-related Pol polyprotein from transposon TNT 1-94 [Cajanus cajan]
MPHLRVNPGPIDDSLLTMQSINVFEHIWNDESDRVLRIKRATKSGHRDGSIPDEVRPYLARAGMLGVAKMSYFPIDHQLISALVERWRPETHTFHMTFGERTITLEDVSIFLSLNLHGDPIIGCSTYRWVPLVEDLFEITAPTTTIKGGRLKMSWVYQFPCIYTTCTKWSEKELKDGREKSRSKSKSRYKNVDFYYCNKPGHIQNNFFLWKKEHKGKKGKQKEKDHDDDCITTTTSGDLILLRDYESFNHVSDESMWIIDSGAMLHVTLRKEFFTSYTSGDFGMLKMGNDVVFKVIGVSDVCLQTNMGMQLLLRGVKHAPDVCFNLISMQMLDDGGYDNHFGSKSGNSPKVTWLWLEERKILNCIGLRLWLLRPV